MSEALIWLSHGGDTVALDHEHTKHVAERPHFVSADGRFGWFHHHFRPHAELRDLATGSVTLVPCDAGRLPYGFVGTSMFVTDRDDTTRVRLIHPDGTSTDGDSFTALHELRRLPDNERAVFVARFDGEQRLVVLDLATLAWTSHTLWSHALHATRLIAAPDGRVIVLLQDDVVANDASPELHIAVVEGLTTLRTVAVLPYRAKRDVELAGDSLWLACSAPSTNWQPVFIHVRLDTGAVDTTELPPRPATLFAIARSGERAALRYGDGVYLFERGTATKLLDTPIEASIAMSPSGTLAVLADRVLHLFQGTRQVVAMTVEPGTFLTWRTSDGSYALPWL